MELIAQHQFQLLEHLLNVEPMAIERLVTKKMPSTPKIIEEIHLNFVRNYAIRKAILESKILKDIEIFKIKELIPSIKEEKSSL